MTTARGQVNGQGTTIIGVYERTLEVSVPGIWDNVLDWEHVPFAHPESFCSVELLARREDGWTARVGVPPDGAESLVLDMSVERERLRYTATTLAGPGEGTRVITYVEPVGPRRTRIRVEFHARPRPPTLLRMMRDTYLRVYRRLWDQDEEMIARLEARAEGAPREPRRLDLGPRARLSGSPPCLSVAEGAGVLLVEHDGELRAWSGACPHRGGPLERAPIRAGRVTCPWHGYTFDLRTGESADGRGLALCPLPVGLDAATGHVVVTV